MSSSNKNNKYNFDNPDRWLVSYADYSTLLFAFFTVLYALSEIDLEKTKQFETSLKKYFVKQGTNSGGGLTNQGNNFNSVLAPPIETLADSRNEKSTQKTLKDVETYLESKLSPEELQKKIKDIGKEELGVRISISSTLLFYKTTTDITQDGLSILERIGNWMKETNYKILVESHTEEPLDFNPPYESLWELTSLRASKVVRYFIDEKMIKASRLVPIGYGNSRPIVLMKSAKLRERNNRVDFLILTEDSPF